MNQMFVNCLPKSAEIEGFKIFPIAFGEDADTGVPHGKVDHLSFCVAHHFQTDGSTFRGELDCVAQQIHQAQS